MSEKTLYHHGIKGQKWGIRRFQNKNGSLTFAGKKRYSQDDRQKKKMDIKKKEFLKRILIKTAKTVVTLSALTLARKYLTKYLNKHINKMMSTERRNINWDEVIDNLEPVIVPFEDK